VPNSYGTLEANVGYVSDQRLSSLDIAKILDDIKTSIIVFS